MLIQQCSLLSCDEWAALGSVLAGLGTIGLLFAAVFGLKQWRAQLTGTNKYEVARKLALLAIQLQEELAKARMPFTLYSESHDRPRDKDEKMQEAQVLDEYYARNKRLIPLIDTAQKMRVSSWEAEVILGKDARERVDAVQQIVNDLVLSTRIYFDARLSSARGQGGLESPEEQEMFKDAWRTVYGRGGDEDEMSVKMEQATEKLLQYLQRHIK